MREVGTGKAAIEVEGNRADVYVNRPEKRNAMSEDVLADLTQAFREVDANDDVWAVAFLGKGDVFCAGMDIDMMYEYDADQHWELHQKVHELFDTIGAMTTPVVVGIKKAAIAGAFELTLPADFRILGEDAKYGVTEIKMGIYPGGGSTQRLPRLVGLGKAKEIVLRGDFIDPEEAERIGLVTEACPSGEVDERTREFADELTERAPLGMERALEAFQHAFDDPLNRGLEVERYLSKELFSTQDRIEGFEAWMGGRDPEFERR
jgi:enoyl-CoA hydratase/carnithine racemase